MKKYTLLEMVQSLLASMESDEVSSITDTVESNDLALLIRDVYYDSFHDLSLPELESVFQLDATTDNTKPVQMTVPTNVSKVYSIKYDNQTQEDTDVVYRDVCYKKFSDFISDQEAYRNDTNSASMVIVNDSGEEFTYYYRTDKAPQYFTTVDDNTLFFDSIDTDVDTTLQKSKTLCTGIVAPSFTLSDSFIPDMDATQFPYLINKAKTRAFNEKKQMINQESIAEARRQKIISQKTKKRVDDAAEIFKIGARYGR